MAKNLSTVKVSGTSTEKTNFESTLTTADAGFEITVIGGNTFRWNGSSFDIALIAGAPQYVKGMRDFSSGTLANGTPVAVAMEGAPIPSTVWVVPVSGDTVLVEVSFDAGVSYENWAKGSVTARASDVLNSGVTHLRFSRTAGSGTTSTYGVS